MKILKLLFVILIIYSCKEKTFADDIELKFDKTENLNIQKFNEDANEEGSNFIYIGPDKKEIDVKYYKSIYPEPEPIDKIEETDEKNPKYFWKNKLSFKDDFTSSFDMINDNDVEIVVKIADIIPLYKKDYETDQIKKYQAFPVFIKNKSDRIIKMPIEFELVNLYAFNGKQFQLLRNSNYFICGTGMNKVPYFELKPQEIMIYAIPFFENGKKINAKIKFYEASSQEFEISLNDSIFKKQRMNYFESSDNLPRHC